MPDLLHKAEAAASSVVATVVASFSATYAVCTGLNDDNLTVPNVVVTASATGEQIPPNSGNKIVTLRATLNANPSDTTLESFAGDAKLLFDVFNGDDIGALLSATTANFYAYDPPRDNKEGSEPRDDKLSKYIELELLACETDI